MKFKEVALSTASTEAKVAALALLMDKELIKLANTVLNVKKLQGPQGEQGLQGPKGEQGDRGFDGTNGKDGSDGKDGKDGEEGKQGVGVADAKIDFDGSLVITLTDGTEINAGDVVPLDTAEKIRVIGNGGGTSQSVLDAIEAIQATIATYGTMALQNKTSVDIEGGTIDSTVIGAVTPAAGTFTTLTGGGGSANYFQTQGSATTKAVEVKALGSDTNIAFVIDSKGTGAIDLAAGSRGVNISNGGTVTALTVTASGSAYTTLPTPAITAPTTAGGVQAVAAPVMFQTSFTITNGGTGYTVGDTITGVGGTFTTAWSLVVSTVSAGVITGLTTTGGFAGSYTVLPVGAQSVTGGTGSSATVTINTWAVRSLNITNAGSGYVEQPTVSFSGGGGSGAAAYASVGSYATIKAIGSGTNKVTNQAITFETPNSITSGNPAFIIRDAASFDSWYQMGPSSTQAFLVAKGNANASAYLGASGSGSVRFTTNGDSITEQMRVAHTASAVNYVQVTGSATSANPVISAQGSDSTVNLSFQRKGNGNFQFLGPVILGSNAVNYFTVTGAATTLSPSIAVTGTDTNIDLTLTPKGTGNVRFGTYTASMALTVQGYIEIKDSGGTVRKLAVIA